MLSQPWVSIKNSKQIASAKSTLTTATQNEHQSRTIWSAGCKIC
jgi:hypothetical protein